jgi:hypothetical protein
MADRIETHLIVKAVAEGFDKLAKEHKKVGDEVTKQKGLLKGLKDNWLKVGVAMAAVGVAIQGLKKLWDFAEQGAQVRQQAESFDFLMNKIGVTTDVLGGLREASRGTVDDMTLMSGTATLLAGAGDELAKKLAEATPQLMEIAKASNKLNPSLGTTAFMYESIATGIKRAQPLILDNLGLTIKVGEANKKFADKIGIAVTALSAEQKAMAMLDASLEAGDNLIAQVGGTTESATDAFARLTTALKNTGDAAKAGLGESLGPAAGKLADLIEHSLALETILRSTGITLDDYAGYVNSAGEVIAMTDQELIEWYESLGDFGKRLYDISGQFQNFPPLKIEVDTEKPLMDVYRFGETVDAYLRGFATKKYKVFLDMQIGDFVDIQGLKPSTGTDIPVAETTTVGSTKPELQASGGPLANVALVGEEGAEMIVNGIVIPADMTKRLMGLGLAPGKRFGLGGAIGTGNETTPVIGGAVAGLGAAAGVGGLFDFGATTGVAAAMALGGGVTAGGAATAGTVATAAEASAAVTAPAAATEAAAAVASTVSAAASIQSQAIQSAIAKQVLESKKLLGKMEEVRLAIEDLPDPIGERVIHGMETIDTR